jgi:hypothetical protein
MHPYYYEKLAAQRHQELTADAIAYRTARLAQATRRSDQAGDGRWGWFRRAVIALAGQARPGPATTVVAPRFDLEATGTS